MKSTLLWSLTALCGVVGGVVAWNGGWRAISPTWTPIRITKVVWVTNEVSHGAMSSPWSEPLKPLEPEQSFDQKAWKTNDYGHRIPITEFWTTNTTLGMRGTNYVYSNAFSAVISNCDFYYLKTPNGIQISQ